MHARGGGKGRLLSSARPVTYKILCARGWTVACGNGRCSWGLVADPSRRVQDMLDASH